MSWATSVLQATTHAASRARCASASGATLRKSRAQMIRNNMDGRSPAASNRACPEPPDVLHLQGVSAEQACRMLDSEDWPLHKVQEQWKLWDEERAANMKKQAAKEALEMAEAGS